jgi:hypothetical protein
MGVGFNRIGWNAKKTSGAVFPAPEVKVEV